MLEVLLRLALLLRGGGACGWGWGVASSLEAGRASLKLKPKYSTLKAYRLYAYSKSLLIYRQRLKSNVRLGLDLAV
jgi:hypothetical protein